MVTKVQIDCHINCNMILVVVTLILYIPSNIVSFYLGRHISYENITDHHDINEILLKVALNSHFFNP